ncbi:MAG: reverse transcriptase family protein [Saprospiraceae bacterium]
MIISKNQLFFELKTNKKSIQKITNNIDKHYSSFIKKQIKPNGNIKERKITNPSKSLKLIQRNILKNILQKIQLPNYLHGSIKKKSNITNARTHQGNNYHLCTDIKSFFPSISNKQVYKMFISYNFNHKIASLLTKLTTYKGNLPQGTPTSSYIANLVFLNIDKELVNFCKKNSIIYTRYVDDLTFSSQQPFKNKVNKILGIITDGKFKYHHKKTFYKKGPVEVTGILVKQNSLKPNDETIKKLKTNRSEASKKGIEDYIKRVKQA